MPKRLVSLCLFIAAALGCMQCQQEQLNIVTRTRGNLPVARIVPGVAGQCLTTDVSGNTVWATCAAGGGSGYATIQNAATAITQRAIINWINNITCADNAGPSRSDCNLASTISTAIINATTGFQVNGAAGAGKVLIGDGSNFVPGDPLVQGLFADGSTSASNPVPIGGYDTAGTPALHRSTFINGTPGGTEYGIVTRNIPSGTQPVSGSVSVSNFPATQPVSGTVAVSNFPATQPVSGTVAATQSGTWTVQPGNTANTTAWKVDGSAVTQPVSGTVSLTSGQQIKPSDGTNVITVKPASTASVAADTSLVTQLSPNQPNLTTPLNVRGAKTNNNAAPDATEIGDIPALANAASPSFTEGNEVKLSIDLKGNLRVNNHPPDVLGCYMVNGRTGTYGGQAALAPLFSFRWGDATHLAVIQSVKINVATTTAATAATQAERELIIARSFSASDTGGTSVTMTGNNQKMRTSQATSLVTNIQFGQPLTAGTRTLDANPISSVVSFLATNMTGMDIGCGSGGPFVSGTAWTCVGGLGMVPLLDVATGDYPIVLAQNEGIIVRIGKDAQPTSAVQQTYVTMKWCEVNAF